jgi:hypothetical protein
VINDPSDQGWNIIERKKTVKKEEAPFTTVD